MPSLSPEDPVPLVASPPSIAFCGPEHRAEQAQLFNACFRKKVDAPALVWRYDENPAGPAITLVARAGAAGAVSGYACSPRHAIAWGNDANAGIVGQTGDVMTLADWRRHGLFSSLDRACRNEAKKKGWPLVFGLPNQRSAHIFVELGWRRIGSVRPWSLWFNRGRPGRAAAAGNGALAALRAPLRAARGRRARAHLRERAGRLDASDLTAFPPDVDRLSARIEKRFDFMVRRRADVLDWRFFRAPSGLFRAVGVYSDRSHFQGYAVVQLPRPGEAVGYLVDVLVEDEGSLACALSRSLELLEAAGASLVRSTAIEGSWWSRRLLWAGFERGARASELSVIVCVHDGDHPLAKAARSAVGWYFTDGDRDDETMG